MLHCTWFPQFVAAERNERQRECLPANCVSAASFSGLLAVSDWSEGTRKGKTIMGSFFAYFLMTQKVRRRSGPRPRIISAMVGYSN